MNVTRRSAIMKAGLGLALAGAGVILAPVAAEAQGRGTLQATATVVETRTGFDALRAARSALAAVAIPRPAKHDSVATVAQVSIDRPSTQPGTLVLTIAYTRN